MVKRALITGITGQDGSYLAESLLAKGYQVFGVIRRASSENIERIKHIRQSITLLKGELTDPLSLFQVVSEAKPHEIYNLGAMSFVGDSFNQPAYTVQVTGMGAVNIIEICKRILPEVKFYQASTSEIFGEVREIPQKETTPFQPSSPYGYAKLLAHHHTRQCRLEGMFASCGILFNHESPRRGYEFVTRKISDAVARYKLGLAKEKKASVLTLGNLDSKRDWGFAKDYVEAMWSMLQHPRADDFIIATGKQTTVRNFVRFAYGHAGIAIEFKGSGIDEKAYDVDSGDLVCQVSPKYFRPVDVVNLLGDASKAKELLNWSPKIEVQQLVGLMVDNDLELVQREIDQGMIRKITN